MTASLGSRIRLFLALSLLSIFLLAMTGAQEPRQETTTPSRSTNYGDTFTQQAEKARVEPKPKEIKKVAVERKPKKSPEPAT